MLYQQTQHSDLIGFQIPFQSDLKNLFLHPKIMKKDLTTTNVSHQSMDHLDNSCELIQIDLSFEFQVNI
jgi:hypothetical protein